LLDDGPLLDERRRLDGVFAERGELDGAVDSAAKKA
jgi:hypothetical protein